ncbi:M35 family metallo-endopeptidase [Chitinimonas lacunae]|uniref:M35 family metallo-endopeptidase n=1 Tax=Chitinimonas lacunae TaxID=1963018 RepID=A0ABV8MWH7_9NEIS
MFAKHLIAVAISAFAVAPAFAETLKAEVTSSPYYGRTDGVRVTLTLTNTGERPLVLPRWFVPDGVVEEDLFEVLRDGQPVEYLGPEFKRAPLSLNDLVSLAPGASLSRTVDLTELYDLSESGQYSIRYRVSNRRMLSLSTVASSAEAESRTESKVLSAWIEGRMTPSLIRAQDARRLSAWLANIMAPSVSFEQCTTTQQNAILSAVNASATMAGVSYRYLSMTTPGPTTRYVTWFGKYSLTNWNVAREHFKKIQEAVNYKPLVFNCGCTSSAYAYVYPNQPYKIYLCKAFWSAPNTGTDSRGGTIIHELSHFTVVADTDDHAYGQSAAKQLAISSPTKALNNADNHEYFAENTPSLP